MPKTKIVATIGPKSFNEEVLTKMIKSGLSTIRINTAHVELPYIGQVKKMIEGLNQRMGSHVGIMVDLKGPELRTGPFNGGKLDVKKGARFTFAASEKKPDISISHPAILDHLKEKDMILFSDGRVRMRVISVKDSVANIEAIDEGSMRDRSRINIPGKFLPIGSVTDRDKEFLKESVKQGVDFFALSFVQGKDNVIELEELIHEAGGDQFIVSKIETKSGLQNIREITRVSDFIMVARGDLGVELPLKEVSLAQKRIIEESHKEGVPTIVATQMLESMVKESNPTRAEVSDVTNAILDNADALMLSEESSIGDYPVEAVTFLSDIAEYVESKQISLVEPVEFLGNRVAYSIARSAKNIANEIDADAILAFTKSGNTAKMISAVRPNVPIYAAVISNRMANKLNLYRGVEPVVFSGEESMGIDLVSALSFFEAHSSLKKGDRVVLTSGAPYFLFGGTNEVRVSTIGTFIGRGYPSGKSVKGKITRDPDEKREILLVESDEEISFDRIGKYQAIIFTGNVSNKMRETLRDVGSTVLHNTRLAVYIKDGEDVFVDGETGVIIH